VFLAAAKSSGGGSYTPFILIIVLVALAYFVLIRPNRNRQRRSQQMQQSLQVGAEVMTTAGLYGTVTSVDDETVTLEVSPGVHNRYVRAAVAKVVTPVEPDVTAATPEVAPVPDAPADSGNRREE
jgi:preprotein translocase subunit YajC